MSAKIDEFQRALNRMLFRDRVRVASMLLEMARRPPLHVMITNWFSEAARQVEAAKKQNRRAGEGSGSDRRGWGIPG